MRVIVDSLSAIKEILTTEQWHNIGTVTAAKPEAPLQGMRNGMDIYFRISD